MGATDTFSEREELTSWLKQHETIFFFNRLEEERIETLKSMALLNTTGTELTRDFYRVQGAVLGMERAEELANNLAKGLE